MSGPSGAGAPPPAGVVCNSALSFVASAQPLQPSDNVNNQQNDEGTTGEEISQADKMMPPGLKDLYDVCSKLYSDQPNPLQVTTKLKYWLGGEDPLDYISMYWNPGKPDENIPPHWHYISFGLSDLHGDGRVHPAAGADSGYGFELTLRARTEPAAPAPLWPAALLHAIARYVFTTGNKFCAGDHISWHRPLDPGSARGSRIRHLLVARDPALETHHTRHGTVQFLQLVGCTSRELKAAQRGSGFEVLKHMKEDPNCGGTYLVTCASRRASASGARVQAAVRAHAHLAGVSCLLRWLPTCTTKESVGQSPPPCSLSPAVQQQIKDTLRRGLSAMSTDSSGKGQAVGHMSTDSFEMSSMERALPQLTDTVSTCHDEDVQFYESVHIFMNAEGASLLPLAIDGRIKHGAHFTWREGACAVTMLAASVSGAFATQDKPFAGKGDWLQVVISKEMSEELSSQVSNFSTLCQSDSESDTDVPSRSHAPVLPLSVSVGGLTLTVLY